MYVIRVLAIRTTKAAYEIGLFKRDDIHVRPKKVDSGKYRDAM